MLRNTLRYGAHLPWNEIKIGDRVRQAHTVDDRADGDGAILWYGKARTVREIKHYDRSSLVSYEDDPSMPIIVTPTDFQLFPLVERD